jgi:hypothetical protein
VTIYQWSRPCDLAHYESFAYDHATFGLRAEGLTTSPFSDRALDRGLTGVLATLLRLFGISSLPNVAAHSVPLSGPLVAALQEAIDARPRPSPTTQHAMLRSGRSYSTGWIAGTPGGSQCGPGISAARRPRTSTGCCASRTKDHGIRGLRRTAREDRARRKREPYQPRDGVQPRVRDPHPRRPSTPEPYATTSPACTLPDSCAGCDALVQYQDRQPLQ